VEIEWSDEDSINVDLEENFFASEGRVRRQDRGGFGQSRVSHFPISCVRVSWTGLRRWTLPTSFHRTNWKSITGAPIQTL